MLAARLCYQTEARMSLDAIQPGTVLRGKYRVERVLGAGGMGVVVLATHLRMSQLVAIKVLRPEARGNDDVVLRFAREARAASKLRGEHAVRILDVDDSETGDPFLVMEYLEGSDLQHHLETNGALAVETAAGFMLQVCEGIAEAHAAGIVHRDLKPSNLFLTTRPDGSSLIKILDFGISKATEPEAPGDFLVTKPATAIGSPAYMSPEQLKGAADVDARTDIWSLGVVFYQLLTNALPFEATTTAALAARIAADPPTPLRERGPEVPEAVEQVVLSCIEKERARRFADIAAFARALAPFARGGESGAERVARVAEATALRTGANLARVATPTPIPAPGATSSPPQAAIVNPTVSLHEATPNSLEKALITEYGSTVGSSGSASPHAKATTFRWAMAALGGGALLAVAAWFAFQPSRDAPRPVATAVPPPSMDAPIPMPSAAAPVRGNAAGQADADAGALHLVPRAPHRGEVPGPKSTGTTKNPLDLDFR